MGFGRLQRLKAHTCRPLHSAFIQGQIKPFIQQSGCKEACHCWWRCSSFVKLSEYRWFVYSSRQDPCVVRVDMYCFGVTVVVVTTAHMIKSHKFLFSIAVVLNTLKGCYTQKWNFCHENPQVVPNLIFVLDFFILCSVPKIFVRM